MRATPCAPPPPGALASATDPPYIPRRSSPRGARAPSVAPPNTPRLFTPPRPRHFLRLVAGQLHAEEPFIGRPPDERELAAALLLQPARDRHLAHRHARAKFLT